MLPRPNIKYAGYGPLELARLTVKFEGVDDIEFLAIQDVVATFDNGDWQRYRTAYFMAMRDRLSEKQT